MAHRSRQLDPARPSVDRSDDGGSHRATLLTLQRLAGRIAGRVDDTCADADVLTEIQHLFGYSGLGLGVVRDGKLDVFYSYAALIAGEPPVRTVAMSGISGRVARTGEPIFARDVRDLPEYVSHRPDTTQEICVPVRAGDTVVGVLNIEATDERRLDETDLDVLLTIGDHLGTAISNHFRIAELERRNQHLRLVERVTTQIASQVTIRQALPAVLAELEATFGYGSSGIGLVDGERLIFAAVRDSNEDSIQDYFLSHGISIETGICGLVARTGEPVFIRDVTTAPDYLPTSPGIEQEICVPIRANGHVIGILNVETSARQPLEQADFETLMTVANHLGMAFERSDLYEAERRSRTAMEALQRISTIVNSTLDSDEALRRIVEALASVFDYPYVSIALLEGDQLELSAWHGLLPGSKPPPFVVGVGVAGRVAATGKPELAVQFTTDDENGIARADTTSQIAVPIRYDGELAGVLNVEGNYLRRLTTQDLDLLETFAEYAGTTIANARRYEQVQQLAMRDPITELPNYRQFQTRLVAELARAERHSRPLALLLIDLDGFKAINDAFGHLAGDDVLRQIGTRLSRELRESDVLARYAGDEFVVILPETDREQAQAIADRLRDAITNVPFQIADGARTTIRLSIGVATSPADAKTFDDLIRAADTAMYWIKRAGK